MKSITSVKNIFFILCLSFFGSSFAQKKTTSTLYVVFNSDISCNSNQKITEIIPELEVISSKHSVFFKKGIALSKIQKDHFEKCSKKAASRSTNPRKRTKLDNIYIVYGKDLNDSILADLKTDLEVLNQVSYCYISSNKIIAPPTILNDDDIAPTTPDYFSNQTYVGANPGVDMQYAWDQGHSGTGINISNIEFGFNQDHEDIAKTNAAIASGMTFNALTDPGYIHHGTAVTGIVYAGNNGFGITGLAHGADKYTFYSEYTEEKGYDRINAITVAISEAKEGDVVIYEMQTGATSNTDYVQAEYDKIVWELTKSASDAGITVVAAAGNGNVNLDDNAHSEYAGYGDSGAIIVGAGTPDTNHNKVSYSTYGARVNLQGWGENVWATGQFDQCTPTIIGNDSNQAYTPCFRGTSSATPIVASCAAVLQSYYHSQSNLYLTPLQIRDILVSTGIAQGTGGHIGPLPNMKAAMTKVDSDYLLSRPNEDFNATFIASPNPTSGNINITLPDYFSNESTLEIYNTVGQKLQSQTVTNDSNSITLNSLQNGLYVVKVYDNNYSVTKQIVKK